MKKILLILLIVILVLLTGCARHKKVTSTTVQQLQPDEYAVVVSKVNPQYTETARKAGIEGSVMLEVEILPDGNVGTVVVKQSLDKSPGGLDEAAMAAVKKWKFTPAKAKGVPVASKLTIPVRFALGQK
jgi:periplasmic protein TonB